MNKVTRVTIVNHSSKGEFGRVLELWGIQVETQLQDEGKTLKVFISDRDRT